MSQPEVPDGAPFELESVKVGSDAVVVRMKGDADLHNAPALRDALERAIGEGAMTVVVDLTGVTFVDSMMLGVLLGAVRRLRLKGGEMRIAVDDPHASPRAPPRPTEGYDGGRRSPSG